VLADFRGGFERPIERPFTTADVFYFAMAEDPLELHLSVIGRLKHRDESEFASASLDHDIAEASGRIRALEDIEQKLRRQLDALQAALESTQAENDELDKTYQPPACADQGDFFDQLRALEATGDRLQGELSGLRTVHKKFDSEINFLEAKSTRLNSQISALASDLSSLETERRHREGEAVQARGVLVQLDADLDAHVRACNELRSLVKGKFADMRAAGSEASAMLQSLRAELEAQLRMKRALIARLSKSAKDDAQERQVRQKLQQRGAERTRSAANWQTERAVLAAKVRKANDDLGMMARRVRGAARSSTRLATRKAQLEFGDEEAKAAIMREIAEVEGGAPSFLRHTIDSEMRVAEELKKKLVDMERTQLEIHEFQKGVMELLAQQRAAALSESRLKVLRRELTDLRASA
jgi:chaperonin cofactor prefoldin